MLLLDACWRQKVVTLLSMICLAGAFGPPSARADDRVMVRVGHEAVTYADMQDEARFWRLSEVEDDEMERLIFSMIDRRVLLHGIADKIILTEDEQARSERVADEAMTRFVRGRGGVESLNETLRHMGWSLARLRQFLERRAEENTRVRRLIQSRVKSPAEEDIREFEQELRAAGEPLNVYAIRLMEFRFDPESAQNGRLKARDRAFEALLRLERGESFQKVARETSDDPVSRELGGYAGEFTDKDLRPEFEKALQEVGEDQPTRPLLSGNSYYVLELIGRRSPARLLRAKRFSEAKNSLLSEVREDVEVRFIDPELIELGLARRYAEHAAKTKKAPTKKERAPTPRRR